MGRTAVSGARLGALAAFTLLVVAVVLAGCSGAPGAGGPSGPSGLQVQAENVVLSGGVRQMDHATAVGAIQSIDDEGSLVLKQPGAQPRVRWPGWRGRPSRLELRGHSRRDRPKALPGRRDGQDDADHGASAAG